jgi:hypothetical protein
MVKRGGKHPKHPPCPGCGKALYKKISFTGGVKKSNFWAFCKNTKCVFYGKNQVEFEFDFKEVENKAKDVVKITNEQKIQRRKQIIADLLSEEFTMEEISSRNKCSLRYVEKLSLKIKSEV